MSRFQLKSFLKTSGGKGYHVVVPIKEKNWDEVRDISKNIAILMETKWPDKYTSNIRKDKRKDKIFIDWVRNTKGATSVAPYSLRIKDKATVSFPIKWSELDKIKPDSITLKKALIKIKEKDGIKVLKSKDTLYKIEVDMNKTTMDELFGLFKADDIQDITISSTPLEDIIKDIYRGKNNG